MPPDRDAAAAVAKRLVSAGVKETDRIVVIHVSAGNPFRRWPHDHFVALASALAHEPGVRVVITSGPSEHDARERIGAAGRGASVGECALAEIRPIADRP